MHRCADSPCAICATRCSRAPGAVMPSRGASPGEPVQSERALRIASMRATRSRCGDDRSRRGLQALRIEPYGRRGRARRREPLRPADRASPAVPAAAASVRLAGEQQPLEPVGAAERVGRPRALRAACRACSSAARCTARGVARPATASSRCSFGTLSRAHTLLDQRRAGLLVADVARPLLARREALAEVVHQRGEAHRRVGRESRAATSSTCSVWRPVSISGCHCSGCGTPNSAVDLRKHHRERAAVAQHLEVHGRPVLAERALGLDPDALRHQRAHLAARDDAAHQLQRLAARP